MKKDIREEITQKIIKSLEGGVIPWRCPFDRVAYPTNYKTNHKYRGVNTLILWLTSMFSGYTTNHWLGFRQAHDLNAHVKKGEKGTPIVVYSQYTKKITNPSTGQEEEEQRRFFKTEYIWNLDQIDDLEIITDNPSIRPKEEVETLVKQAGVFIRHQGECAFYNPLEDFINMPYRSKFKEESEYYSTLFHECIHLTGHEARLDRLNNNKKEGRAFEELVAEVGASFLCAEFNIKQDLKNSASYIDSWVKALKEDETNNYIFKAAKQASDAVDYLMQYTKKGELICA